MDHDDEHEDEDDRHWVAKPDGHPVREESPAVRGQQVADEIDAETLPNGSRPADHDQGGVRAESRDVLSAKSEEERHGGRATKLALGSRARKQAGRRARGGWGHLHGLVECVVQDTKGDSFAEAGGQRPDEDAKPSAEEAHPRVELSREEMMRGGRTARSGDVCCGSWWRVAHLAHGLEHLATVVAAGLHDDHQEIEKTRRRVSRDVAGLERAVGLRSNVAAPTLVSNRDGNTR